MSKQRPGKSLALAAAAQKTTPPAGSDGVMMSSFDGSYHEKRYLLTLTIAVAPQDLTLWGSLHQGADGSTAGDIWGLHNDRFGRVKVGVLGAALAVGTHHFILDDIAVYDRIYVQKSDGVSTHDVSGLLTEILETGNGG